MGVYIDMEMPKDRPQLLWVYPNRKALTLQSDVDPWKELQAVPVPPHGRLINADALFETMERTGWYDNADRDIAEDIVLDAPTVIPADESNMDSFIHIFEEDDEENGMDSFIRIFKD